MLRRAFALTTTGIFVTRISSMWPFGKTVSQPGHGAHSGRAAYDEGVKQHYLNMQLEVKRSNYRVEYVDLQKVPKWSEYKLRKEPNRAYPPERPISESLNDKVSIFKGDITALEIDAVVNAANQFLRGGGGVDGAIHRAANEKLLQAECRTLKSCSTGDAKATGGYQLPARYIIHTVGPQDGNPRDLHSCYVRSLAVAREIGARTVAFPCIATGIYGFPNDQAAKIAVSTVRDELTSDEANGNSQFDRIIFCVFMDEDLRCYEKYLPVFFPRKPETAGNKTSAKRTNEAMAAASREAASQSMPAAMRAVSNMESLATSSQSVSAGTDQVKQHGPGAQAIAEVDNDANVLEQQMKGAVPKRRRRRRNKHKNIQ